MSDPWLDAVKGSGILAALFLLWRILSLPIVGSLMSRLVGGNGSDKRSDAGAETVDFWRIEGAKIIEEALGRHERFLTQMFEQHEKLELQVMNGIREELRNIANRLKP